MNFGPPDWLPYGSDRAQKYREDEKPLTLSHDALLVTLVRLFPDIHLYPAGSQTSFLGLLNFRIVMEQEDGPMQLVPRTLDDVMGDAAPCQGLGCI